MSSFTTMRLPLTASAVCAAVLLCASFVSQGECQTTPPPLASACSTYKTCDTCVPNAKVTGLIDLSESVSPATPSSGLWRMESQCLWCFTNNNCTDYPVRWFLPPASVCQLSQARWGVCWLNFEALIITLAVVGGTILISIIACCCCCCCCKKRRSGHDRDEERFARRREEIKQRSEERKVERKARHDEIRRKYGLMGDSDHPYSKFENE